MVFHTVPYGMSESHEAGRVNSASGAVQDLRSRQKPQQLRDGDI